MSGLRRNLGYKKILECIQEYYKIKYSTAKYLYFRGLRTLRKDEHRMPLKRSVQMAIIVSDKDINWGLVNIGEEESALEKNNVPVVDLPDSNEEPNDGQGWITVIDKKEKRERARIQKIIKDSGLYL
jgi:hypothetical protein